MWDIKTVTNYANSNGRSVDVYRFKGVPKGLYLQESMKLGNRVVINTRTNDPNGGHMVTMKSITQKNITYINGASHTKYIYRAMDPGSGGVVRLRSYQITNSYNIISLW
jgi:hypothetical protein